VTILFDTSVLVAAVLATRYQTHATRLNLNNLVGVPQTILAAPDGTESLVIEAGGVLDGRCQMKSQAKGAPAAVKPMPLAAQPHGSSS